MIPGRRDFLLAAAAVTTLGLKPAPRERARVTQEELNEAIRLHEMWLADINSGQRGMFGGRDLSGLEFGALGGPPVNLTGADFVQSDLSGTQADDILAHHCNFNGAKFDACRWLQPAFAFSDMRRASAKFAKWGNSTACKSTMHPQADLRHAVLTGADLTGARICGYFYGTKLGDSALMRADFSNSDFLGPSHYEMSFAGANLSDAKLSDCRISSASFFRADCSRADFSRTVFSDVRMKGCDLSGACFQEAEIEHLMLSSDQMNQANL